MYAYAYMKRIAFYIEEKLLALLKARQQDTGVPVSEQIRRAIVAYIKGESPPKKRR